jgi:hypothetical protein
MTSLQTHPTPATTQIPFRLSNALTFFYVDRAAGLACARSRIGGTMLLAADPPAGAKYAGAASGEPGAQ